MGRFKLIETPEALFELFEAYIKDTKSKPFIITDWVGGLGKEVQREKERPLTMEAFREFGYQNNVTIKHYFDNTDSRYNDYGTICSRIKDLIRSEQIAGGMAGIYNPSITQRLNGLKEQTESEVKTSISILNIDPLDDSTDNLLT